MPIPGADVRFADNPLVVGDPNIRFYAGCPITAPDGSKLGTLCLIDRQPRQLSELDVRALRDLADGGGDVAQVHTALTDELTGLSNRHVHREGAQTLLTFQLTSAWFGRSPGKWSVGTLFSRCTTALPERVPRYS